MPDTEYRDATKVKHLTPAGYQDVRMSGCQDVRMSGCQDVRISGCQDARITGYQDVRMSGCQDVRTQGCEDARSHTVLTLSHKAEQDIILMASTASDWDCSLAGQSGDKK